MARECAGSPGVSLRDLWRDETATTALEYALALALVALSAFVVYQAFGLSTADSAADSGQRLDHLQQGGGFHGGHDGPPGPTSGNGGAR